MTWGDRYWIMACTFLILGTIGSPWWMAGVLVICVLGFYSDLTNSRP